MDLPNDTGLLVEDTSLFSLRSVRAKGARDAILDESSDAMDITIDEDDEVGMSIARNQEGERDGERGTMLV